MKRFLIAVAFFASCLPALAAAEDKTPVQDSIFDDTQMLQGYTEEYRGESKDYLIAMIKDDTLNPYQTAAAIRVFKEKFSDKVVSREKLLLEKDLIRRLNKTNAAFVEVEIMHTLCLIDRYKYFYAMVPALIQKMDHYNPTVNGMAYSALNQIIESGSNRAREARIIFGTLRKVLFLSRLKLRGVTQPDERLSQKLKLLRWSIKVLGKQELKKLPKEVINLL